MQENELDSYNKEIFTHDMTFNLDGDLMVRHTDDNGEEFAEELILYDEIVVFCRLNLN